MKYKTILFLFMLTSQAQASDYLTLTIASKHFNTDKEHNEVNPGIGFNHNKFIIGGFVNSHNNNAYYAGYEPTYTINRYVKAGVQLGLIHGYTSDQLDSPELLNSHIMVLPEIIIGHKYMAKIGVIPSDEPVLTLQFEIKI